MISCRYNADTVYRKNLGNTGIRLKDSRSFFISWHKKIEWRTWIEFRPFGAADFALEQLVVLLFSQSPQLSVHDFHLSLIVFLLHKQPDSYALLDVKDIFIF